MAKLGLSLKNVKVQKLNDYSALPDGKYSVVVAKADVKQSKAGGHYLNVGYQVVDGDHKGRIVFDIVNIEHSNPEVVSIGMERLATIAWATDLGKDSVDDTDDLINKTPFDIMIKTEEKDGYTNTRVKAILRTAPIKPVETKTEAKKATPWKKQ